MIDELNLEKSLRVSSRKNINDKEIDKMTGRVWKNLDRNRKKSKFDIKMYALYFAAFVAVLFIGWFFLSGSKAPVKVDLSSNVKELALQRLNKYTLGVDYEIIKKSSTNLSPRGSGGEEIAKDEQLQKQIEKDLGGKQTDKIYYFKSKKTIPGEDNEIIFEEWVSNDYTKYIVTVNNVREETYLHTPDKEVLDISGVGRFESEKKYKKYFREYGSDGLLRAQIQVLDLLKSERISKSLQIERLNGNEVYVLKDISDETLLKYYIQKETLDVLRVDTYSANMIINTLQRITAEEFNRDAKSIGTIFVEK